MSLGLYLQGVFHGTTISQLALDGAVRARLRESFGEELLSAVGAAAAGGAAPSEGAAAAAGGAALAAGTLTSALGMAGGGLAVSDLVSTPAFEGPESGAAGGEALQAELPSDWVVLPSVSESGVQTAEVPAPLDGVVEPAGSADACDLDASPTIEEGSASVGAGRAAAASSSSGPAQAAAAPTAKEAPRPYAKGARHGFAAAALDDLLWEPLQRRYADPVLRPEATSGVAQFLYDGGAVWVRTAVADRSAMQLLQSFGVSGTTGFVGRLLGFLAYRRLRAMVESILGEGDSWEGDVEAPATIFFDNTCVFCLSELQPGHVTVLVHPPTGHACVCSACFVRKLVQECIRTKGCPLCRKVVKGKICA